MKFKKTITAIGMVAAIAGAAPNAFAAVELDTNGDGTFNVTGVTDFDWEAIGNVVFADALPVAASTGDTTLSGFFASDVLNSTATFDFYYQSRVTALPNATPLMLNQLSTDGTNTSCALAGTANCYEITVAITAQESAQLIETLSNGDPAQKLNFTGITGEFIAYLDNPDHLTNPGTGPDAMPSNGAGYVNGLEIFRGTLNSVTGDFTGVGSTTPSGSNAIEATVTSVNSSVMRSDDGNPIAGSTFTTTVQFFADQVNASTPGDTIGIPAQYTILGPDLIRQADANQSVRTALPEPGTLVLMAGALVGMAGFRRRG